MKNPCDFTLAELLIVAASEAWRDNGEWLASGLGVVPRLGASLAKLSHSPQLLMTDSEAFLVRRHAMIGPTQIDRWGQSNLSCVGDYHQPKAAMLGVRGLPGNSINHINSFFVPNHNTRVFVSGEVDMVSGVGFKAERWPQGVRRDLMDIRRIITDLCVMDFEGPERAVQVRTLHPGVSFEEVQEKTGFPLLKSPALMETAPPTPEQLALIRRLDPHDYRSAAIKGNPPGIRQV